MELCDNAIKMGYLDEDKFWEVPVAAVNVFPSKVNEGCFHKMINEFYMEFLKRPTYLFTHLLKTVRSKYRLQILFTNLKAGTRISTSEQLWGG